MKLKNAPLFIVFALILLSCNKEGPGPTGGDNGFILDGTLYELNQLGLTNPAPESDNQWYLTLSKDASPNVSAGRMEGTNADFLELGVKATASGTLTAGTYTYTSEIWDGTWGGSPGEFGDFFFGLDADYPDQFSTAAEIFEIIGGTVTVERDGEDYIINYTLDLSDGRIVSGYFKGKPEYIAVGG